MGLKHIIVTFSLIAIFGIAFMSFALQLNADNNSAVNITQDSSLASLKSDLESTASDYATVVNSSMGTISETEPSVGATDLVLESINGIWKSLITIPRTLYNLTVGVINDKLFGGNSLITTIIGAIISAITILYVWKWIKSGSPE